MLCCCCLLDPPLGSRVGRRGSILLNSESSAGSEDSPANIFARERLDRLKEELAGGAALENFAVVADTAGALEPPLLIEPIGQPIGRRGSLLRTSPTSSGDSPSPRRGSLLKTSTSNGDGISPRRASFQAGSPRRASFQAGSSPRRGSLLKTSPGGETRRGSMLQLTLENDGDTPNGESIGRRGSLLKISVESSRLLQHCLSPSLLQFTVG